MESDNRKSPQPKLTNPHYQSVVVSSSSSGLGKLGWSQGPGTITGSSISSFEVSLVRVSSASNGDALNQYLKHYRRCDDAKWEDRMTCVVGNFLQTTITFAQTIYWGM